GLRHLVRIDRVVGAGDVHRAGHAESAAEAELAVALPPTAGALDLLEALQEAVGGDPLTVDGLDVLALEVAAADLDRSELQLLRDLIELHLEGEARLHRAVAALRSARRLVGEDAGRIEAVAAEVIRAG